MMKNATSTLPREVGHWYELDLLTGFLDTLQLLDPNTGEEIYLNCGKSLHLDDWGNLWGLTCSSAPGEPGSLLKYELSTCNLTHFTYDYRFNAMTMARDGNIWLCAQPVNSKGELVYFDTSQESFRVYQDKEGNNPLRNATPHFHI